MIADLKTSRFIPPYVLLVFGPLYALVGFLSNLEWVEQKLGWGVLRPIYAVVPIIFAMAWIFVLLVMPDAANLRPRIRHYKIRTKEHPQLVGATCFVVPVRNESVDADLKSLAGFLEFRGKGKTIQIHDAVWYESFPNRIGEAISRSETRHLVIAITQPSDKECSAVGYEKEPPPNRNSQSLRAKIQFGPLKDTGWDFDIHNLPDGRWTLRATISGYKYQYRFKQKLGVINGAITEAQTAMSFLYSRFGDARSLSIVSRNKK